MARTTLSGRDAEMSELNAALADVNSHRHTLAVVRGTPGIGKTALLTAAAHGWQQDGHTVIRIPFSGAVEPWDLFGFNAIIAALQEFCNELGDFELIRAVNSASLLGTPERYRSTRQRSSLLVNLAMIFGKIHRHGPIVVIADDLDTVPNPTLALAPACLPGCLVVAACRDDGRFAAPAVQLAQLADHLIDLGPLSEDYVGPLVGKRIRKTADDSLLTALRHTLGPLACDPGTLLSTVDELCGDGRITIVHGRACLSGDAPIRLAASHDLVSQVRRLGTAGHELMVLATTGPAFGVEDLPTLAATTGRDLAEYGHAVDTLAAVGALVSDESGQLSSTCPALSEAVLADALPVARRLHGEVAEHLLKTGGNETAIADHIAAAEKEVTPSATFARVLLDQAGGSGENEQEGAARWYHAALWHLDRDDQVRPRVLSALLRLLLRTGDYERLSVVAEEHARFIDPKELSAAALIAALHTSSPIGNDVREAVEDDDEMLEWHDSWFAGDSIDFAGLVAITAPLSVDRNTAESDGLADALAMWDVAALLAIRTNSGIPDHGVLARYHRVVTLYSRGDFPAALSAVRTLIATPMPADSANPVQNLGRLLAAEICVTTGELKQAANWLAAVGDDRRIAAMRGWAEIGLLAADGDNASALARGWWAYRQFGAGEVPVGGERLLSRLTTIAMSGGQADWGRRLLTVMTALADRMGSPVGRAALEFVRGVATKDESSLRASADMARRRGHFPDLLVAFLALGELAVDPRPWLHDAYEIAGGLGSAPLRARSKAIMRDRDVAPPRADADRPTVSDTEMRVIDLIRVGRTNRQIADTLRVTEKTVEYHLTRLFLKTGCRSRVDLAAAKARGLLTAVSA
ncbi:AAA family ATPase [Amycolatopsis sp. NPDC049868]|uniref:AAA family ATPase n=1 Tax=Amycolatopsis sp. NPDC049868 TaxID=3363934 RepID=UPI0037923909